jgi:hypothetical protein
MMKKVHGRIGIMAAVLAWLALSACVPVLSGNGKSNPDNADRRLFLNDPAANDSLPGALTRVGVRFVMQPGESYTVSVSGDHTADRLSVYYSNGASLSKFTTVAAVSNGGREFYSLSSNRTTAQLFMAQLLLQDGTTASSLTHVALASLGTGQADLLRVRLIFVQSLRGLPDSASKAIFAQEFFQEMSAVFQVYGITVSGSYQIVKPNDPALGFPFNGVFTALPGDRIAGNAHVYLVDSIVAPSDGVQPGGEILGFAPREAFDLYTDGDSRVVLSRKGGTASDLAITASHELGHFFGFRHTTASALDVSSDQDYSNLDDGFTSTARCLEMELAALAQAKVSAPAPSALFKRYCVRTASNNCPAACDLSNLMFAYDCKNAFNRQDTLTDEQIAFLRKNMNIFFK